LRLGVFEAGEAGREKKSTYKAFASPRENLLQKSSIPADENLVFVTDVPHTLCVRYLYLHLILISLLPVVSARKWTELDGVTYLEEKYSDGDSFRAKRNTVTYIFRLYWVDCPETDTRYPDRVQEQADYFGVDAKQAIQGGVLGAEWLHELLEGKELTVYTRYADARGESTIRRYYAMIKIGDRWLSELLVENGLARVFGVETELPDGTSARNYSARLKKLEKEAKEANRGIWGLASGVGPHAAPREIRLKAPTSIFSATPPHSMVGRLPAGWKVTVGAPTRVGFRAVTFVSPGGNDFQGEIQETSIP